ncbi:hypothetical protein F5Y13DRAFT_83032 [Hypoxylon sp. FL1857]|nr:hypothetical protein F5Y13DRAFT_83032 [Hypoxylon sp. FL1857]
MSSRRPTIPQRPRPHLPPSTLFLYGCGAGILGVAFMTAGEKIEQLLTSRANSYVPGATLARLLGVGPLRSDRQLWLLNAAMHCGQGAAAGVLRAWMSDRGVRGPFGDLVFLGVRLLVDQTLENWSGVGALPWTWPVNEQIIDIIHKTVFALATGYFTDKWVQQGWR